MKAKMYSEKDHSYLFDHVLDGFKTTYEGIQNARDTEVISDEELTEFLKKNSQRLIERIREFKIMNGLLSIFFVALFGWMQISGTNLEMRRPARTARASVGSRTKSKDDVSGAL